MKPRVLVVDDNRELAENVAQILEVEGYEPIVIDDPHQALETARVADFDAAILDVRMPGMDGVTLHAELARLRPCATFVLITAYACDERIEEAINAGVEVVLSKPVPVGELLRNLPRPGQGVDVLVVEDDLELGANVVEALREQGYHARCARSLAAAQQALDARVPTAVIADVRLPDGNGAELAVQIRRQHDIPVVLMTAFASAEAERLLADHYGERGRILAKPFPTGTLLEALREVGGSRS